MDPNFDKLCNFMLKNSGAEIRVTVWELDPKKVKNIGIKILHNIPKHLLKGNL